jgi:hypothetical protein
MAGGKRGKRRQYLTEMKMVGGRGGTRTRGPLLAKQVLSQLSYTPTEAATFILKHLPRFQNPFLRVFIEAVPKLFQNPLFQGDAVARQASFRWQAD